MIKTKNTSWEIFSPSYLEKIFSTNLEDGLLSDKIANYQKKYGKNIFETKEEITIIDKIAKQFISPLALILLGAGIVTFFLREFLDTIVIFAALIINVIIGVFYEERASRAFEKLNKAQIKYTTVIRDGKKSVILSENLVPGDIVALDGGFQVPADIRILKANNLSADEASLTGEWVPVLKESKTFQKKTPLYERSNMVWKGTLILSGNGIGIVVETGENTEIGKIAKQLGTIRAHPTPLQLNIKKISKFIIYIITVSITVILIIGILRGEQFGEMFLIAIAIAVSAMPEGLPAAVTVTLALGMESILKRGGLVRNLLAVETLGATTVILTDKTGTLTEAKMKLNSLYTLQSIRTGRKGMTEDDKNLLIMAVLASDAFVEEGSDAPRKLTVHGRPIEKAVVVSGLENGVSQNDINDENKRIEFLKFESRRRFGASLNMYKNNKKRLYLSGEPEFLLDHSTYVLKNGKVTKLNAKDYTDFQQIQNRGSADGMRFIAVSYKDVSWKNMDSGFNEQKERNEKILANNAIFVGLMTFEDPIRKDVKEAVLKAQKAGARIMMVTGDNPKTAKNVAIKVGIAKENDIALLGSDLALQDDKTLLKTLREIKIFARALPEQKLRISRILRDSGEVVAMTGDGINDAPALRAANIGIAIGSGTEIAREASDIILLNNSFSIIVSAIEEGRKIIDNIKKILAYMLSTSFAEVLIIGGALIFGASLPLLPAQILWSNIIGGGPMSFAFAFEKGDKNIMNRKPNLLTSKDILTPVIKKFILTIGIITGIFLTILYFIFLKIGMPIDEARTMMFVAISMDAIFFTFSLKSFDTALWKINIFSNIFLIIAFIINILILIATLSFTPLRALLSLTTLSLEQFLFLCGIGVFNLITIETIKYFLFFKNKQIS